uniref:hypothetical protein n=1 Tax=Salmonella sp. s54395 TaxID=3159664 RepID=UPI00398049E6
FTQLIGNLGSIASPILIYLDKLVPNLSFMVMITSTFLATILCLFLPETKNTIQPENPEDLQKLFDSKRLFACQRRTEENESQKNSSVDNNDEN